MRFDAEDKIERGNKEEREEKKHHFLDRGVRRMENWIVLSRINVYRAGCCEIRSSNVSFGKQR